MVNYLSFEFIANDDCWHRACQTEECQWASQSSTLLSMKQRRFIASCPDENQRLLPCDTDKNPHLTSEGRGRRQQMLCFYKSEQYCKENNKCVHISSKCFKNLYAPLRAETAELSATFAPAPFSAHQQQQQLLRNRSEKTDRRVQPLSSSSSSG